MAHTPGPWTVASSDNGRGSVVATWIKGPDDSDITGCYADEPFIDDLNNASLMAAAPDLLAACKALIAADGPTGLSFAAAQAALRLAREAVARAEGPGGLNR